MATEKEKVELTVGVSCPEPEHKPGAIFAAMAEVMKAAGSIAKGRDNKEQNYKFRGIDDVYNELHAVLGDAGVFTTCRQLQRETRQGQYKSGSTFTEVRLALRWYFWAKDGSYVSHDAEGVGMDTGDKASNKAMSVSHKYALLQVFCIPTDEPKDPENDSHLMPAAVKAKLEGKPAATAKPAAKPVSQAAAAGVAKPAAVEELGNPAAEAEASKKYKEQFLGEAKAAAHLNELAAVWATCKSAKAFMLPADVLEVRDLCNKIREGMKAAPAAA